MWKNYGMTFIEYIFLSYFRKKNSHILVKGKEKLAQILHENKPVIFISGHFANFELMSMEITKKNIPLAYSMLKKKSRCTIAKNATTLSSLPHKEKLLCL